MSNALDGGDGRRAGEQRTRNRPGPEPAPGAGIEATFEAGLIGLETDDEAASWLVGIAGVAGVSIALGVGTGAWLSLGAPADLAGATMLGTALLVAGAFAREALRSLPAGDGR